MNGSGSPIPFYNFLGIDYRWCTMHNDIRSETEVALTSTSLTRRVIRRPQGEPKMTPCMDLWIGAILCRSQLKIAMLLFTFRYSARVMYRCTEKKDEYVYTFVKSTI